MSWALRGSVDGTTFDTDAVGWSFGLSYGRRDTTQQPQPTVLQMSAIYPDGVTSVDLADWQLGREVLIEVQSPTAWVRLFVGSITDVVHDGYRLTITATSNGLAGLGRVNLDVAADTTATFATFADAVVTAAITDGASAGWQSEYTVGDTSLLPLSVAAATNQPVLAFLQGLAPSEPNGYLCEVFGGTNPVLKSCAYFDRKIGSVTLLEVDLSSSGDAILTGSTAEKRIADFVNRAAITYPGGVQVTEDSASVAAKGAYTYSASTRVLDAAAAAYLGNRAVSRGIDPAWRLSALKVSFDLISDTNRNLFLEFGSVGALVTIPSPWSGAQTRWFVEGWQDTITQSSSGRHWVREFYVSDMDTTKAAQQWFDVTASLAWSAVDPALTWQQADLEVL